MHWILNKIPAFLGLSLCLAGPVFPGMETPHSLPSARGEFQYRMKGMVRLIFFWVGKDDVGGARIKLRSEPMGEFGRNEVIELLIGSDPARVPGGHNRWGLAKEMAIWECLDSGSPCILTRTRFDGFMSQSSEQSMGELRKANPAEGASNSTTFEATVGEVTRTDARAARWRFQALSSASFGLPESALSEFDRTSRNLGPELTKTLPLSNTPAPLGFLTAVNCVVQEAVSWAASGRPLNRVPTLDRAYFYNAGAYKLRVKDFSLDGKFRPRGWDRDLKAVRLDLQTEKSDSGSRHDFTLVVGVEPEWAGVPLRIEDRPRWWLKVQLDLVPMETRESSGKP